MNTAGFIAIGVAVLVVIGFLILLLACISKVKHDYVAITEKMGEFNRILNEGIHMLNPFAERIVQRYPLSVIEVSAVFEGFTLILQYQIVDVKKYHYKEVVFTSYLTSLIDKASKDEVEAIIKDTANLYGVAVVTVKII